MARSRPGARALPDAPSQPARASYVATWTGHELVQVGYTIGASPVTGTAWVPGSGWHQITPLPDAGQVQVVAGVAAGPDPVLIFRERTAGGTWSTRTGVYLAASNSWLISTFPLPQPAALAATYGTGSVAAAETGGTVVVALITDRGDRLRTAALDTRTGRWQSLTAALPQGMRQADAVTMTTVGGRILMWWVPKFTAVTPTIVYVRGLTPGQASWQPVPGYPMWSPPSLAGSAEGRLLVEVSPDASGPFWLFCQEAGATTLACTRLEADVLDGTEQTVAGTSAAVLVLSSPWNGSTPEFTGRLWALDPQSGHWATLPAGQTPGGMARPQAELWTGSQLLVTNGTQLWSFGP
jgi:hypothetical protein